MMLPVRIKPITFDQVCTSISTPNALASLPSTAEARSAGCVLPEPSVGCDENACPNSRFTTHFRHTSLISFLCQVWEKGRLTTTTRQAQYTLNAHPTIWSARPDQVRLSSVISFLRLMSCRSCDCCASIAFKPAISACKDFILVA